MAPNIRTDCEGFHRRDFLKLGTAGLLGLGLADLLRLEAHAAASKSRKATSVIMIWLAGGPATIDMWDLKPDAPEGLRGEFKPIPTSASGIRICEHLPKLAKVMDKCTLVRSLNHNVPEHGVGTLYMTTGNRPTPALDYPALGCLASKLLPAPAGIPSYVTFSGVRAAGPGYLGAAYSAFEVEGSPGREQLRVQGVSLPGGFSLDDLAQRDQLRNSFDASFRALDRAELPASLDRFHQQALDILRSDKTRKAFDLDQEASTVRDTYGRTPLGQGTLVARRLIEAGVRFVTVGLGGWDTHAGNFRTLRGFLLPQLDQALAALIADLEGRGLLDSTIVYCAGEFGRTPLVNSAAGRDHWARSMAVLLAGGGFKKAYVHGATDAHGMLPSADPCLPDDISATIFHRLGIEPRHEITSLTGRPIAVFREGKIIEPLLG
jgi:Protein of unknown function (DUF1501)